MFAAAILLSLLALRLQAPFPPFVALTGAGVAFLPFKPEIALAPALAPALDPALVLAQFVAPVLVDASFDSSPRDLKRNSFSITAPSVAAVSVTVVAVAVVARLLVPEMPCAAAVTLGAIVAPLDAAAARAV